MNNEYNYLNNDSKVGVGSGEEFDISKPEKKKMPKQQKRVLKWLLVFFGLMIAFTILSRVADSFTVPMVRLEPVSGGTLDHNFTASGTVESQSEINLTLEKDCRIKEIHVKKGQQVKAGELLVSLDMQDLQDKLEDAKLDLRKIELGERQKNITANKVEDVSEFEKALDAKARKKEDIRISIINHEKAIGDAQEALEDAKKEVIKAEKDLQQVIAETYDEKLKQAAEELEKTAKALADVNSQGADNERTYQRSVQDIYIAASNSEEGMIDQLKLARLEEDRFYDRNKESMLASEATQKMIDAQIEYDKVRLGVEEDDTAIKSAQSAIETARNTVESKEQAFIAEIEKLDSSELENIRAIEDAEKAIETAKITEENKDVDTGVDKSKEAIQRELSMLDVDVKKREITKMEKLISTGGDLFAPSDGVITDIKISVGAMTNAEAALLMSDAAQGYNFKVIVDKKEAKYLKQGDKAQVIPVGETKAIEGVAIESITNMTGEESGKVEITATMPKDFNDAGLNAQLKIEKTSSKYNVLLPLAALHESGNESFVLVTYEKQTILGTQLFAEKRIVQVLDKDNKNAALQQDGSLNTMDYIIVQSAKPINEGDRIRVQEE